MNQLWSIEQFLRYYLHAVTRYNVQSPYLSGLISAIYDSTQMPPPFLATLRKKLLKDHRLIQVKNFGAGSRVRKMEHEKVSDIAKSSLSTVKESQFLYRLARFSKASLQLELGTSLGLSSLNLQSACPDSTVISIEAHPEIGVLATELQQHSPLLKLPTILHGIFDDVLPGFLARSQESIDIVFIDGDHTYKSTIKNVQQILPYMSNHGLVILHDIYWSRDMTNAWHECLKLPTVTASIDLFSMGILILHPSILSKVHLTAIDFWKKPWKIGLF